MKHVIMKCGHVSNAELLDGRPICGVCYGIVDGADEINVSEIDLGHRESKCKRCGKIEKSSIDLPLFEYRGHLKKDTHLCSSCAAL